MSFENLAFEILVEFQGDLEEAIGKLSRYL